MAKYCGGYNALAGGQPAWAFRLFTGEIGVSYILRDRDPIEKLFFVMVNNQLLITNDEEQVYNGFKTKHVVLLLRKIRCVQFLWLTGYAVGLHWAA